jgi:hypothetical protein
MSFASTFDEARADEEHVASAMPLRKRMKSSQRFSPPRRSDVGPDGSQVETRAKTSPVQQLELAIKAKP